MVCGDSRMYKGITIGTIGIARIIILHVISQTSHNNKPINHIILAVHRYT